MAQEWKETIAELSRGFERFRTGRIKPDGKNWEYARSLASGQAPEAAVVACSDSRVPPLLLPLITKPCLIMPVYWR